MSGPDGENLNISANLDGDLSERLAQINRELRETRGSLDDAGDAGQRSGEQIEGGAKRGERALGGQARAARSAAGGMQAAREAAERAERALQENARAAEEAAAAASRVDTRSRGAAAGMAAARAASERAARAYRDNARAAAEAAAANDSAGDQASGGGARASLAARGWDRLTRAIQNNERAARSYDRAQRLLSRATLLGSDVAERARRSWRGFLDLDFDGMGKKVRGLSKYFMGFSTVLKGVKIALMAIVIKVVLGFLSALAAGAASAAGGIASMSRGLLAALPILVAAKLGMLAWTKAAEAVSPQLDAIKKRFEGIGEAVARGGLRKGLESLNKDMGNFAAIVDKGFEKIGGSLGRSAADLGVVLKNGERMAQVARIFDTASHNLDYMATAGMRLAEAFIAILDAAGPTSLRLASDVRGLTERFMVWIDAMNRSGELTKHISKGYDALKRTAGILSNIFIGLFNIFRIGARESGWMADGIENLAKKFRDWTESIGGQDSIAKYFRDSMPVVKEFALLIGSVLKGVGGMATSEGMAPLIKQIRTELLPAFSDVFTKVSGQGGLIPSLLSGFTELAKLFTSLDLNGLTFIAQLLTNIVTGITEVVKAVPGLSGLLSFMITAWVVGGAAVTAIGWVITAIGFLKKAWLAFKTVMFLIQLMAPGFWAAVTGPVGIIIAVVLAIVGIFIYMYENFEWFRDAVDAVWAFIVDGLKVVGDWFTMLWTDYVRPALKAIGDFFVAAWTGYIEPVLSAIWYGLKVLGAIIFVVLVAPFVIAWNILSAIVMAAWEYVIAPVLGFIADKFVWLYENAVKPVAEWIVQKWRDAMMIIQLLWQTILRPALQMMGDFFVWLWTNAVQPVLGWIAQKWNDALVGMQIVWTNVLLPVIRFFGDILSWLWTTVVSPILTWIGDKWALMAAGADAVQKSVIQPIFDRIGAGLDVLKGWFSTAVDNIGALWDGLKSKLAVPINFLIDTVWNNGILKVWNWVADKLGLPAGQAIARIPEYATGGDVRGPGTGTSDSIPAMLSNGEHVWTAAEVRKAGGHARVMRLRQMAMAGELGYYASGGPVTPQEMFATVSGALPGTRMTSSYRPGDPGWHGKNRAADLAGPGSNDAAFMRNIDSWIGSRFPGSSELIHTPGPYNIKNGSPHTYSAGIRAEHYNHVHWANNGAGEGAGGSVGGVVGFMWDFAKGILNGIINPVIDSIPFSAPPEFMNIPKAAATKAKDAMFEWAESKLNALSSDAGGSYSGAAGSPEVMAAIQAAAAARGWGSGGQWNALLNLIRGESGFNPNAQNKTSTAYGLFQFLNSTWATVGGSKTSNPALQSEYGMRYIANSYGTPSNAFAKWSSRSPHWYDNGGFLEPGLSMVMNGTGQPEPVFTGAQWDMLDPTQYIEAMQATPPTVAAQEASARDDRLASELAELRHALIERPPPLAVSGRETEQAVYAALKKRDREVALKQRYSYGD